MEFNALVRIYGKAENDSIRIISFVFPVGGECAVAKLVSSIVERAKEHCQEHKIELSEVKIEIVEKGQGTSENQLSLPFPKC